MVTGEEMVWLTIFLIGLVFGIFYDRIVTWMEKEDALKGATSMLVVGGVMVTLGICVPLIGLENVLIVLFVFVATGTPMIVGDWMRFVKKRREDKEALREELLEELRDD